VGDSEQVGVHTVELDKEEEGHIMIDFGSTSLLSSSPCISG